MTDLTQIKEIRDICTQICDVYRNKMEHAGYDKNGELYNFKEIVEYKGNIFELSVLVPQYWKYAENGRGPGKFPPPDAILKWIQHKQLVPRSNNGKVPSTKQLVYVVSRKIALHGTEGKHLLQQTIDETYDTLVDQLVDAITNEIEKEVDNEVEKIYE